MAVFELDVWRWTCPLCRRWISRDTLTEQTRFDPAGYYGVYTTIYGWCSRCGEVTDPQLRPVGAAFEGEES